MAVDWEAEAPDLEVAALHDQREALRAQAEAFAQRDADLARQLATISAEFADYQRQTIALISTIADGARSGALAATGASLETLTKTQVDVAEAQSAALKAGLERVLRCLGEQWAKTKPVVNVAAATVDMGPVGAGIRQGLADGLAGMRLEPADVTIDTESVATAVLEMTTQIAARLDALAREVASLRREPVTLTVHRDVDGRIAGVSES